MAKTKIPSLGNYQVGDILVSTYGNFQGYYKLLEITVEEKVQQDIVGYRRTLFNGASPIWGPKVHKNYEFCVKLLVHLEGAVSKNSKKRRTSDLKCWSKVTPEKIEQYKEADIKKWDGIKQALFTESESVPDTVDDFISDILTKLDKES